MTQCQELENFLDYFWNLQLGDESELLQPVTPNNAQHNRLNLPTLADLGISPLTGYNPYPLSPTQDRSNRSSTSHSTSPSPHSARDPSPELAQAQAHHTACDNEAQGELSECPSMDGQLPGAYIFLTPPRNTGSPISHFSSPLTPLSSDPSTSSESSNSFSKSSSPSLLLYSDPLYIITVKPYFVWTIVHSYSPIHTKSTNGQRWTMPLRGTSNAPKFDGKTLVSLPRFLEDVEQLATASSLNQVETIRATIRYANLEESEGWELLDEATTVPAIWADFELGEYQHKFMKVAKLLIQARKLSDLDRDTLFLSRLPEHLKMQVQQCLLITKSTHHLSNPYPVEDTIEAMKFLLTGLALHMLLPPAHLTAPVAQPYYPAWAAPGPAFPTPQTTQLVATPVVKQEQIATQRVVNRNCVFCTDPSHFMGNCPHIEPYIQTSRACRGSDCQLCLPDRRRIPHIPRTCCLKDCLDCLPLLTTTVAAPIPTVTTGIISLTYPNTDAILDIKPLVFLLPVDDSDDDEPLVISYPDFEPYIARAWASFQADKAKPKGPKLCFDSVEMPPHRTGRPGPRPVPVAEEIISPAVEAACVIVLVPLRPTAQAPPTTQPIAFSSKSTIPGSLDICSLSKAMPLPSVPLTESLRPPSPYRSKNPACGSIFFKQLWVNELAGKDPGSMEQEFGDRVHRSNDGLIVVHHSILLRSLEARVVEAGQTIIAVLDTGSEIVAMPKQVWTSLSLPVWSDHVMTMSNANTSTESTIGVLENLHLDFGASKAKLELYGLFQALRAACVFIFGVPNLVIEMDTKYVKGIINNPDLQPNATINWWIASILLFHFELRHIPAAKHTRPDGLSRRLHSDNDPPEDDGVKDWLDDSYSFCITLHNDCAPPLVDAVVTACITSCLDRPLLPSTDQASFSPTGCTTPPHTYQSLFSLSSLEPDSSPDSPSMPQSIKAVARYAWIALIHGFCNAQRSIDEL
ncbi:hypothetical protein EV363DRAFT_1454736 [Boletus edulis]|nr:hypothetical protein EV363DRAFT_1454736 [Boletus edulis]